MHLLVIVSGDYGELGGAMYFLHGLGLSVPATVLVPSTLSHALTDTPAMRVHSYRTLADIERHIDAGPLDAVMLFSGYLLTVGARFSLLNTLRLLQQLRRRSVPVLTSDPFIGLIHGPATLDFTCVLGQRQSALARALSSRRLAFRLYLLKLLLRGCWHVYASPISRLHPAHGPLALSYSNLGASGQPVQEQDGGRPSWIFVLSDIDYQMQLRGGADGFSDALVRRLREAIDLGKHAVLVAPESLLHDVRGRMGTCTGASLLHNTAYDEFMGRLMSAEYAFYWNYYSFSIIHRVVSGLPVMFFDEGHMVHILPALQDAGITLFYDGWRPPLLRLDNPLDKRGLDRSAAETRRQFERIALGLQQCDSPASILRKALSANQGNVLDAQT